MKLKSAIDVDKIQYCPHHNIILRNDNDKVKKTHTKKIVEIMIKATTDQNIDKKKMI